MTSPEPGGPPIEVVGHRGAAGLHPGNSRAAFEVALACGVDRIECDIQRAADGTLVVVHDESVRLLNGGRRRVRDASVAELRDSLPGFVTLDDLAALVGDRTPLLLDLKCPGYEREIGDAIARFRWTDSAVVSSTHARSLRRLRTRFPTLRLGLSTGHLATSTPTALGRRLVRLLLRRLLPVGLPVVLRSIGATDAMLQHHVASPPLVARLRAEGRRVNVWTLNTPEAIERAVALGVDSITSDRPDLARCLVGSSQRAEMG